MILGFNISFQKWVVNEVLYTKEEQPLMAATTLSINSNFLTDNQVRYFIHVLLTYTVVLSQPTTPQNKKRKRARTWLVVEEEHLFSEQKRITTDAVYQTPLLFILLLFYQATRVVFVAEHCKASSLSHVVLIAFKNISLLNKRRLEIGSLILSIN